MPLWKKTSEVYGLINKRNCDLTLAKMPNRKYWTHVLQGIVGNPPYPSDTWTYVITVTCLCIISAVVSYFHVYEYS